MPSCANCVEERQLFATFVRYKGRSYRLCYRCRVYALHSGYLREFYYPIGPPSDRPERKPMLDELERKT